MGKGRKQPGGIPPADAKRRTLAEGRLDSEEGVFPPSQEPEDPRRLLHELRVHQVELEMQNEELRQTRDEAQTLLQKYTDLYEFAPVGYLTLDATGNIQSVNLAGTNLLGWERSRIIGLRFKHLVHEIARPVFECFLAKAFASRVKEMIELEIQGAGRSPFWAHVEASVEAGGERCLLALFDITERKMRESLIYASEAHYRLLTEDVDDVAWKLDSDCRFTYISPADERLRGYPAGEVIGTTIFEVTNQAGQAAVQEMIGRRQEEERFAPRTGSFTLELPQLCQDGRLISTEMVWVPEHDPRGIIIGYHGITRDISERKQSARREMQLLHAQKLESLGVLAGGIAHDFNNILMAIFGNTDLALLEVKEDSRVSLYLHRIKQAAARAAELAKQMLDYSGRGKFVLQKLDLNRLLKNLEPLLKASISKKAALRLDLHDPLPLVEIDAAQMNQAVTNLVMNASEALDNGAGAIIITTGTAQGSHANHGVIWHRDTPGKGEYVYLEVTDTGCGIDQKAMDKLFDPFFSTKFTGRGLGLAAVHGIVKGHRGGMEVSSEPGNGASFRIMLPAAGNTGKQTHPEEPHRAGQAEMWRTEGTVLLVDDEESVLSTGSDMLRTLGFTPVTAKDGVEAIGVFKKTPGIALVILDLTMPHMDGAQCFLELRKLDPDVKVIVSSGYHKQDVIGNFAGEGLSGFIQKPYQLSSLAAVIKEVIASRLPPKASHPASSGK
ncbi:hypothetical protein GMSM_20430 [Geomonas sp. Red276]